MIIAETNQSFQIESSQAIGSTLPSNKVFAAGILCDISDTFNCLVENQTNASTEYSNEITLSPGEKELFEFCGDDDDVFAPDIEKLLQQGTNPNIQNFLGDTPLHYAVENSYRCTQLLLQYGADVNARNQDGQTPLYIALDQDYWGESDYQRVYDTVKLLIESGADVNAKDEWKNTIVSLTRDPTLHALLIEHGAIESDEPSTAAPEIDEIFYCCDDDEVERLKFLIQQGANVNAQEWVQGYTPLHVAVKNSYQCTKILLEHGANVHAKKCDGLTPLGSALLQDEAPSVSQRYDIVKLLIEYGSDVNARDEWGNTLLSLTTDPDLRTLLIEHGAISDQVNQNQQLIQNLREAFLQRRWNEALAMLDMLDNRLYYYDYANYAFIPNHGLTNILKAFCLAAQGDLPSALTKLTDAQKTISSDMQKIDEDEFLDELERDFALYRGLFYLINQQTQLATDELKKIAHFDLRKRNEEDILLLAVFEKKLGIPLIPTFDLEGDQDPDDLFDAEKYQETIERIEESGLIQDPEHYDFYSWNSSTYAASLAMLGQYDKASAWLTQHLNRDKSLIDLLMRVHLMQRDLESIKAQLFLPAKSCIEDHLIPHLDDDDDEDNQHLEDYAMGFLHQMDLWFTTIWLEQHTEQP